MNRKAIFAIILTSLLIDMLTFTFNIQPVEGLKVKWTVDDDGPADFHTIQEAINAANPWDTIFVKDGTYHENIKMNKTISLIGENKETTIIDGNGTGTVILIVANHTAIVDFSITNADIGIWMIGSLFNNTVTYCKIMNTYDGIRLWGASNCTLTENIVTNNSDTGVELFTGSNNVFYHNNFINNSKQVYIYDSVNAWDNAYPSGGNYWSDYADVDENGDGIGDTPYIIDIDNIDHYPLMSPWPPYECDALVQLKLGFLHIKPGTSMYINASVTNTGLNNLTDIELLLFINGSLVDSVMISSLGFRSSYEINYLWTPTTEGMYNVTAYSPPGTNETYTEDNRDTCFVLVAIIIQVPFHYPTIQQAISIANPEDIIQVYEGIYYENLTIYKPISIIGQDPRTTIINGGGSEAVVEITVNNVNISSFTIQNGTWGIYLQSIKNANVTNNLVLNCSIGIFVGGSNNTLLNNNTVTQNNEGIILSFSNNAILKNNNMSNNRYNFGVRGETLQHFIHEIDESNLVNGKLIRYLINKVNVVVNPKSPIGYLAIISSANVTVKNVTISNNRQGILFAYTTNSVIDNVETTSNYVGVEIWYGENNVVTNSNACNNGERGVHLSYSVNNTIKNNLMESNYECGILLDWSSNNKIVGNYLCGNGFGIGFMQSSGNNINNNTISNNTQYGVALFWSHNNKFYHNNFVNNTDQVFSFESMNTWDDGYPSGGNYWSNYIGVDLYSAPHQSETGSDSIGDTPYVIDENNRDDYPLMKPWGLVKTAFDIIWNGITYPAAVISNSTVTDFNFSQPLKQISFNVAGPDGTIGFCNVTIPKALLWVQTLDEWILLVDGSLPMIIAVTENETHTSLHFTYTHSTHTIQIMGTGVIGPPPDTNPPLIGTPSQEPESDKVTPDTAVTVYVNVTDIESGVKSVILSYKTNSVATWNLTMLYNATTALYQATIPAFPSGTSICYKIIAYDNADNVAINDNAGLYYCYTVSAPVPPLSASINPLSASILVGQSVTFTSTVSGGYTPYTYQWYLDGAPVSEANESSWKSTPTASGIYYVHLKIADAKGNTTQSETARITVATVPVGGYSIPIRVRTKAESVLPYIALIVALTAIVITIKRKTKRKH